MKVMNIKDTKEFLQLLGECNGTVKLNLPTGEVMDIKQEMTTIQALTETFGNEGIKELNLTLSSGKDIKKVLNYLIAA